MKKWIAIFLLTMLLFNTTGYYFSFIIESISAKAEAWKLIHDREENGAIVYLHFNLVNGQAPIGDISFINENEFIFNGRMYDLISRTDANGVATFKCYCDNKETEAVASLDRQIESKQNQPLNSHKHTPLKELFKYYVGAESKSFMALPLAGISVFKCGNNLSLPTVFFSVTAPPPDTFIA